MRKQNSISSAAGRKLFNVQLALKNLIITMLVQLWNTFARLQPSFGILKTYKQLILPSRSQRKPWA